ncbi:MAG: tRNA (adenosine(37)-N6)-threonylcarbamoyltransferase complex ATPase subunit type 1 TsaE [Patescibacteria group bacterium]
MKKYFTTNPKQTESIGKKIAATLRGGETLALIGDLGSGKTTFVKGLARGLGVKNKITSPTFVLFKVYKANKSKIKHLAHADCYRVKGQEILTVGLVEYLHQLDTVIVIEWADKLPRLPRLTIKIRFHCGKKINERLIIVSS